MLPAVVIGMLDAARDLASQVIAGSERRTARPRERILG
jgi:hypothetical protein